ncbi:MAG: 50S ribosomal protein L18 [Candidatus Gastranaerophilales bacterium]|nr:50S ribosomal protein L18 [Candidatus Gastranaerophilales bacterium]
MIKQKNRKLNRIKKHKRVRIKMAGTAERPRLAVFRSNKHIYAQIIDDNKGLTLASAGSVEKSFKEKFADGADIEAAKEVGTLVAQRAKAAGIESIVFDRGGFVYHGRIAALADAAREAGLQF